MSVSDSQKTKRIIRRPERAQDFIVLTVGSAGLLALLIASGALGIVEGIMAAIVLIAGALAYYVGSVPPAPRIETIGEPSGAESDVGTSIQALVHALPFPACYISPEGRVQFANQQASSLFRINKIEGALKSVIIRQPDVLSATERVAQTGAGERIEFQTGEGDELWLAHLTQGPEAGSVFIVMEDRTAVHRAERARADFLANASHELRTPLTALAGFIETMLGPARNDRDSWDGFLEIMHQQTDRMRHLVADLLSLSRIEFSEHRAPDTVIDFSEVLSRTILSLQPIANDANVRLELSGMDRPIPITAKWDEIAQVVQNLVSNAIKYSPADGEVRVEIGMAPSMSEASRLATRHRHEATRSTLLQPRASSEVPAAWMRVEDKGQGIARQHLSRLGERFYRVDESRGGEIEGTGLGLAIVKHIMARHRGGLAVASREGDGASFGVWLPVAEESEDQDDD
ncbi:sensor histidine kinase [Henriciella aquimarina]|uniref:sensor histidine kinase n=1 Tax=Henriciella aquimarina TaxID=545261 RepID=UPI0009FC59E5|nr:ATP-binding protein [Henriciella aquimarina]